MEQQRAQDRDRIWVEWMRAANAGDEIAYRRLLEALAPLLRQVVRRCFAHSGFGNCDVEDVVQETLLAIHLKGQTWDEDEALTPWVTAIARHKLIDSLHRRGRHIELPIDDLIDVLPALRHDQLELLVQRRKPAQTTRIYATRSDNSFF